MEELSVLCRPAVRPTIGTGTTPKIVMVKEVSATQKPAFEILKILLRWTTVRQAARSAGESGSNQFFNKAPESVGKIVPSETDKGIAPEQSPPTRLSNKIFQSSDAGKPPNSA